MKVLGRRATGEALYGEDDLLQEVIPTAIYYREKLSGTTLERIYYRSLPRFGFDERRVKLTWIGASEGLDFAATIKEMVAEVKSLGPNETKREMVL